MPDVSKLVPPPPVKIVASEEICPYCGQRQRAIYSNNTAFCFACRKQDKSVFWTPRVGAAMKHVSPPPPPKSASSGDERVIFRVCEILGNLGCAFLITSPDQRSWRSNKLPEIPQDAAPRKEPSPAISKIPVKKSRRGAKAKRWASWDAEWRKSLKDCLPGKSIEFHNPIKCKYYDFWSAINYRARKAYGGSKGFILDRLSSRSIRITRMDGLS